MQDNPQPRRFPPPWTVEEVAKAYVVTDASGTRLGFVYFDDASRVCAVHVDQPVGGSLT
jgi:hypothetical protein